MKPVESITLTSLVDEIAFRLETAILEGEFGPGTHLLQDELCARFGVSRTPVREAPFDPRRRSIERQRGRHLRGAS